MLEIGSIIDGKYKVLNKIGQGGMSIVYLAINERANKTWAIKEIRKQGLLNYSQVRQRLIAETDILKQLSHPYLPVLWMLLMMGIHFLLSWIISRGEDLMWCCRTDSTKKDVRSLWQRLFHGDNSCVNCFVICIPGLNRLFTGI